MELRVGTGPILPYLILGRDVLWNGRAMRTLSSFLDQTYAVSLYLRLDYGTLKTHREMYCQQLMVFTLRAWFHTFNFQIPRDVIRILGFFFSNVNTYVGHAAMIKLSYPRNALKVTEVALAWGLSFPCRFTRGIS